VPRQAPLAVWSLLRIGSRYDRQGALDGLSRHLVLPLSLVVTLVDFASQPG
jgi:hypothetical protein